MIVGSTHGAHVQGEDLTKDIKSQNDPMQHVWKEETSVVKVISVVSSYLDSLVFKVKIYYSKQGHNWLVLTGTVSRESGAPLCPFWSTMVHSVPMCRQAAVF